MLNKNILKLESIKVLVIDEASSFCFLLLFRVVITGVSDKHILFFHILTRVTKVPYIAEHKRKIIM